MENKIKIRDHRNKAMFKMDDEYLNGYARLCGKNATLVYLCLCRHAGLEQESFPSVETMALKVDLSRDSVMRGIKKLVEWNIIIVIRTRRQNQTWRNNIYTLLDKSQWKPKPSSTEQLSPSSNKTDIQIANQTSNQVAESDSKDSHLKETNIKDSTETSSADVDSFFEKKDGDNSNLPMTLKEFVSMCAQSKHAYIRLIGDYAEEKKILFTTQGQWKEFGRRNFRAAKRLEPYTYEQIGKALDLIEKDLRKNGGFLKKWTLETVEKYLEF